jgi:pyridoxal phosphate enzyme (YggS family)
MISATAFKELVSDLNSRGVNLIAVSKLKSVADIKALYDLGQRDFGENYVQELVEKQPQLPPDIRWHFIGHLQRNKVKYIAGFVHCIHSVDSFPLLQEINRQAAKHDREIACLLQIHIAEEESKYGLGEKEAIELMEFFSAQKDELKNVVLSGLMGMATFTDDKAQVSSEFGQLKALFDLLRQSYFLHDAAFKERSMGMSDDYELAIAQGSTQVRIGSLLFGRR